MELGVHFRLTDDEAAGVRAAACDDERLSAAVAALEESPQVWALACETDKAWDPIACALSPAGEDGPWPARGVIGGARALQDDDDALWITHLAPAEAAEVAAFLEGLSDEDFRRAYRAMPKDLRNPEFGADEEDYASGHLDGLRAFYAEAAAAGQHVVFTVGF